MNTLPQTEAAMYSDPHIEQAEGIPKELCGPVNWNHPCAAHLQVVDGSNAVVMARDGAKRSKVCIVGYAPNSRHLAFYNDPDCEIWGVNQVSRFIPREDRHFQLHVDWEDKDHWAPDTDQRQWILKAPIPTYMLEHHQDLPNSVRYPLEWVKDQLGLSGDGVDPGSGLDYFTSSIAFMYALAIAEGFKEIGIYGIDLIIGREYFFEKACVEFYMGMAHGRGIHIHKPSNTALLWQSHRYGYELAPNYGFWDMDVLASRKGELKQQADKLRDEVYRTEGRVKEAEWVADQLAGPAKDEYAVHLEGLRKQLDKGLNAFYAVDGALQEVTRMHDILDIKHKGGEVRIIR